MQLQRKEDMQKRLMTKYNVQKASDREKKDLNTQPIDRNTQKHVETQLQKRQQHFMERENQRRLKQINREKYEEKQKGNYDLLYPYVTYAEEDFIQKQLEINGYMSGD